MLFITARGQNLEFRSVVPVKYRLSQRSGSGVTVGSKRAGSVDGWERV